MIELFMQSGDGHIINKRETTDETNGSSDLQLQVTRYVIIDWVVRSFHSSAVTPSIESSLPIWRELMNQC